MVNVMVTYDDLMKLQKDSADKAAVISLLGQEFPDDTCQLIAIKAILGIKDEEDNTDEPSEPAGEDTPSDTPATEPSGDDTEGAGEETDTTPEVPEGGTE